MAEALAKIALRPPVVPVVANMLGQADQRPGGDRATRSSRR